MQYVWSDTVPVLLSYCIYKCKEKTHAQSEPCVSISSAHIPNDQPAHVIACPLLPFYSHGCPENYLCCQPHPSYYLTIQPHNDLVAIHSHHQRHVYHDHHHSSGCSGNNLQGKPSPPPPPPPPRPASSSSSSSTS